MTDIPCERCLGTGLITVKASGVAAFKLQQGCPVCHGYGVEHKVLARRIQDLAPFVTVESPFAGSQEPDDLWAPYQNHLEFNIAYGRACMRDCILRGEAPYASHLLYTQPGVLDDTVHKERELGMHMGWSVMKRSNMSVVYTDLGWSSGMIRGYNAAMDAGQPIEIRRLGEPWSTFTVGRDYISVGNTEEAKRTQLSDYLTPQNLERAYIEIDTNQGYGVAFVNTIDDPGYTGHVEVIRSVGFALKLHETEQLGKPPAGMDHLFDWG